MSVFSHIISLAFRRSAGRFDKAAADPLGAQQALLLELLRRNASTEYGRRFGFGSIRSVSDYQRQVPVITYEDIAEDMRKVLAGAKKVFTAEDPIMFARSSGTTGEPKFIPVTPTCQGRAHKDAMRTWLFHAQKAHPDLFAGSIASLVSPAVEGYAPGGVPFGSTSGHMYKNMPMLVRSAYAIPYQVFEIADYNAKYYAIMRIAVERDVRFLATANPSSILRLCEKADEFSEELIRDIHDGTLARQFVFEPQLRRFLEGRLKADPGAARRLDAFRGKRGGLLKPRDYWPRLVLIGCWKGGTVSRYIPRFCEWFNPDGTDPVPVRDWGYLSSEARASVPLSDEGSHGVLTVGSNFFEFVETGEFDAQGDASSCTFLTADALECGKEYYIFLTTSGGLYRYDINDIVRVVGHYNLTPQIEFVRKGRGMTNLTGEKVSVNHVIAAVERAADISHTLPAHFRAEADDDENRYLLRVEFEANTSTEAAKTFLEQFDRQLKQVNLEYKAKRDSMRLGAPVLHMMREGWYERGHRRQVMFGARTFQAKTQLLTPVKLKTEEIYPELKEVVELDGN